MRRRPARSTLFSYTTLFRSRVEHVVGPEHDLPIPYAAGEADAFAHQARSDPQTTRECVGFARRVGYRKDRKSTRLNSSHEWISYAVFSLKKKTNNTSNTA